MPTQFEEIIPDGVVGAWHPPPQQGGGCHGEAGVRKKKQGPKSSPNPPTLLGEPPGQRVKPNFLAENSPGGGGGE